MFPDVKDVIRIRHVFFVGAVGVGDILRSLSQVNAVDLIVMRRESVAIRYSCSRITLTPSSCNIVFAYSYMPLMVL